MIKTEEALQENITFSTYLEKEYEIRRKINSSYSWRAFAKYIEVDQSTLSKFIKGKRRLSWRSIENCMEKLSTPNCLRDHFLKQRELYRGSFQDYEDTEVQALEDWLCWAALEYFKIDACADHKTIAERFSVSEERASKALRILETLGFINKENDLYKLLRPNNKWLDIERTNAARRRLQEKYIELSKNALKTLPVENRYHGALTVAIDKERLPEAQRKLAAFQEEFGKYIQKDENLDEVFQLTLSFFPLTKSKE